MTKTTDSTIIPESQAVLISHWSDFVDTNFLQCLKHTAYRHYNKTGRRYTLTSGQVSDEYVDVKNTILHHTASGILAAQVNCAIGLYSCDAVAGVELGGALLAQLIARIRMVPCLIVRKDERTHGTTVNGVDGLENLDTGSAMKPRVWLLEDVITTGQSTIRALTRMCSVVNLFPMGVVAVVDRQQGGVNNISATFPGMPVRTLVTLAQLQEA
jgi:orotate phosphoribosyltransferase